MAAQRAGAAGPSPSARSSPGPWRARSTPRAAPAAPSTPRSAAPCASSATTPTSTSSPARRARSSCVSRRCPAGPPSRSTVAAARSGSPPGVELDLGSTGKGLAADLAAEAALEAAGPDVRRARQPRRRHRDGRPRPRRRLADPHRRGQQRRPTDGEGEVIAIERGAVATSSTTVRRWRTAEGVTRPPHRRPADGLAAVTPWRTATVVAATCEQANAASTAAIVMGDAAPGLAGGHRPARAPRRERRQRRAPGRLARALGRSGQPDARAGRARNRTERYAAATLRARYSDASGPIPPMALRPPP